MLKNLDGFDPLVRVDGIDGETRATTLNTCIQDALMPTSVRLEKDLEARLDRLAKDTGRTKAYYLREIIARGIEDMEDIHLADQAYLRIQQGLDKTYSAEEVYRELGLDV
jgi:RHH-type transcriptional regulator, rel operon repressor / antitoxin RelB